MPDSQLQNCPKCQQSHIDQIYLGVRSLRPYLIQCEMCSFAVCGASEPEAIAAWNKRGEENFPLVSGSMVLTSLAEFEHRCAVLITKEQQKPSPDNSVISALCEATRLSREFIASKKISPPRESTEHEEEKTLRKIASIIPHQHCMSCNQMSEIAIEALNQFQAHTPSDTERELIELRRRLELAKTKLASIITKLNIDFPFNMYAPTTLGRLLSELSAPMPEEK